MTKRKKLLIGLGLIAISATAYFTVAKKKSRGETSYREIPVRRDSIEVSILGTGTVQPENRVEIKPPVAGRIEQVLVKEGQSVKKGQILAWMSSLERAAMLDAARAQGEQEFNRWEENYKPTPIIAPIKGTIILRNVESGQTFTNSDSVFVMSDRLTIKAQVDETDIAEIKLRQKARITLDAYPKHIILAHVEQIAYEAKTTNNVTTYVVAVLPEEIPPFMRSGMTANVSFLVSSKEEILTIANDALRMDNGKFSVLVKVPDQRRPEERQIKVGVSDGKLTEIWEGLEEGDIVLASELVSKGKLRASNPFVPAGGIRGGRGSGRR